MLDPHLISLESEAGFRVLFECATIGILVTDEKGIIELSNPCAEKLFGYGPTELVGKAVEILIPPDLSRKHQHHRESYFDKPKARPMGLGMELYALRKSGEVFPVEISLGHYELEGEKLAVAFVTDITDRVKAKKIVAEREAWFRNMADNSPVMIWVSDETSQYTYFNNTWLHFTGRSLKQELGNGWGGGVHVEDLAECVEIYRRAFAERQTFKMEYRLRRNDEQYRWIQDVGKPTYSADGVFTGFIGSCTDIHEQRMMNEELERLVHQRTTELNDALISEKEMNELKSRFVSMAAHEFRTPLSVVLSSTALVEQYTADDKNERIKKHLGRIRYSVTNLTNILNDFLSLDKLEQGNVEIEYQTFDIQRFIQSQIDDAQSLKKNGQQIHLLYQGEAEVMLDQKKFRYVLMNLLSNALKYSGEGSDIKINVINDQRLCVTVEDQGIGIPEEEQKFMFNKFFRAANTDNIQGTGLGLTIVKRYVELMNGTISFRSTAGIGTIFTIALPSR
jgi:PAS domain S-box-containing protein